MNEQERLETWERYLAGEIDPLQHPGFEEQIQADPAWQEWIARYQLMEDALDYQVEKDLRQDMEGWKNDSQLNVETTRVKQVPRRIYAAVGVAAAIFLFILGGFWYSQKNYSDHALTMKYYQIPISTSTRLPASDPDNEIVDGLDAFENQDWSDAAAFFSEIASSSPNYQQSQFFLGHAYFNAGLFDQARSVFESINEINSLHEESNEWMVILSLLNSPDLSQQLLEKLRLILQDENHTYFVYAQDLQKDLNRFWRIF